MREIARITKAGGAGCVCAPHTWFMHNNPIDCWRIFPEGMRTILEDAGLVASTICMQRFPKSPPERGDTIAIFTKPKDVRA